MARSARALVTGGAGFIGSHLCDRLLDEGTDVVCLDNFKTGSLANIAHLLGNRRFLLLKQDVADPIDADVDEIYNLACPASPRAYESDPIFTLMSSVRGAQMTLELARKTKARILQASTSEIYGDPDVHPQPEEYRGNVNPIGIRACYDEGKRCAEALFFDYWRQFHLEIKVARIFNTYGPRVQHDDGRVISNFIVQALQDRPLTVYGTGEQTRSFCYIADVVDGLIRLMRSAREFTGPVNLGNPWEITIGRLAAEIVSLTGSRGGITHLALPRDDPRRRRPDIRLAKAALGWEPRVLLLEGLRSTIEYFDHTLERSDRSAARAAG